MLRHSAKCRSGYVQRVQAHCVHSASANRILVSCTRLRAIYRQKYERVSRLRVVRFLSCTFDKVPLRVQASVGYTCGLNLLATNGGLPQQPSHTGCGIDSSV